MDGRLVSWKFVSVLDMPTSVACAFVGGNRKEARLGVNITKMVRIGGGGRAPHTGAQIIIRVSQVGARARASIFLGSKVEALHMA